MDQVVDDPPVNGDTPLAIKGCAMKRRPAESRMESVNNTGERIFAPDAFRIPAFRNEVGIFISDQQPCARVYLLRRGRGLVRF